MLATQHTKANDAIRLCVLILLSCQDSKIKTHQMSRVKAGRGAKWGIAAGIDSGGVTLIGGAVAGAAVGAKLFHQSLGLSDEDGAHAGHPDIVPPAPESGARFQPSKGGHRS
jgi:hypothetical protein